MVEEDSGGCFCVSSESEYSLESQKELRSSPVTASSDELDVSAVFDSFSAVGDNDGGITSACGDPSVSLC